MTHKQMMQTNTSYRYGYMDGLNARNKGYRFAPAGISKKSDEHHENFDYESGYIIGYKILN